MDANGDLGLPTIYWKASRTIIYYQVHLYYNAYTYIYMHILSNTSTSIL